MPELRIELPELGLAADAATSRVRELALTPRVTRGGSRNGGNEKVEVKSRIVLSGPDLALMKPRAGEDPKLADRRDNSDFWSMLMNLTVEPKEPEMLTSAWVRIALTGAGGGPAPTAFAMDPGRQEVGTEVQKTTTAGVALKVLDLGRSKQETNTVENAEVLALELYSSQPGWELRPSPSHDLRGPTDFVLVIKSPQGSSGAGKVSLGAVVEWEQGLLRRKHEVSWVGDDISFDFGNVPTGKGQG